MPSNHLILCHPRLLLVQSFPASGSFSMSHFFAMGGQSIGVSASAAVLPMNTQDWFPLGWTSWISLQSKGLSRVFSNTTVQKHQFFGTQLSLESNSYIHTWLLEKTALTRWTFVSKVRSLLFILLSRLVIASLPRSKHLLISWLWSPSAVILEPQKIKSAHCFHCLTTEEELKSLLMKVKDESEKVGLKPNIQKMKIMASDPIISREIDQKRFSWPR